jgi:hypothetical protein
MNAQNFIAIKEFPLYIISPKISRHFSFSGVPKTHLALLSIPMVQVAIDVTLCTGPVRDSETRQASGLPRKLELRPESGSG